MPDNEAADGRTVGAEGHANAHFLSTLLDGISHEAVNADGGEDEGGSSEDGEEEHVEVFARGGAADDFGHRTDAGDGEAAAGLTELFRDGGDVLMGIAVGADDPGDGADASVEGGYAIGDLGLGNNHELLGIAVEAAVANVAGDADDLTRAFSKLRADIFADDDLLADGILFGPIFLRHGLVDDDDEGCRAGVLIGEVAAAQGEF